MSERLDSLLDRFARLQVTVLGDAMLDGYLEGSAERVCREAPVPVVRLDDESHAAGGAANTAANLAALGARVRFVTVVGDDEDGRVLVRLLEESGIACEDVIAEPSRSTIAKRRLVADGQLLVRFDTGTTGPVGAETGSSVVASLAHAVRESDALLVSDYGCGLLTQPVVQALSGVKEGFEGAFVVDSTHLGSYRSLEPDVVKPSISEAVSQLAIQPGPASSRVELALALGDSMLDVSGARVVALTLDQDGVVVFEQGREPVHWEAWHRGQAHPAGAGDTFLAAFTLAMCAGADRREAAQIAQVAAGLVVGREGTSRCTLAELRSALSAEGAARTLNLDQLAEKVAQHRAREEALVFTNGCFDILHPGHIALLEQAKQLGDVLVVGVNSDESVRALKGDTRPVNALADRLRVLSALSFVDYVVPFEDPTARRLVKIVRPDVYVKGGDYQVAEIPEAGDVIAFGGRVEILPCFGNESTSGIIDRIRRMPAEQVS